jgi:hypothetical protein
MRFLKRTQFILLVLILAATLVASSACGGSNNPPVITSLTANPATVSPGDDSTITCIATDADSDQLTYTWTGTGGAITGNGSSVILTAPATPGSCSINVVVSDGRGGTDTRGVAVTVATAITTGSISIASTPAGAAIYIDGTDTGSVTPLTISNVAEGNHDIELTYYHYIDKIGTVTVTAGETTSINWPFTWAPDQTLTIQPDANASKDAPVFQDHPDTNYNDNQLAVSQHIAYTQAKSYIQFNLSSIPSGAVIIGARLGLWYSYSDVLSTDAPVGAYKVTGDWNASKITWTNQTTYTTTAAATVTVPADPTYDFIYWNILDLAKGWFNSPITNNGLVLASTDETSINGARIFLSSVATNASQRPKLEIIYFNPSPITTLLNVSIP